MKKRVMSTLGAAAALSLLSLAIAGGTAASGRCGRVLDVAWPSWRDRGRRGDARLGQDLPLGEPGTYLDHLQRAGYQRGRHAGLA